MTEVECDFKDGEYCIFQRILKGIDIEHPTYVEEHLDLGGK